MGENPMNDLLKFREAFKQFALIKIADRFDRGEFDKIIKNFTEGNIIEINLKIKLLPNDVIFMRLLAGMDIPENILQKVKRMWKIERRK